MGTDDFFELAAALGRVHTELGVPSKRDLARIAGCSPTTIDKWLSKKGFPQDVSQVLKVVEAIGKAAARQQRPLTGGLANPQVWRVAHDAERKRRRDRGSAVMTGVAARPGSPGTPVTGCDPVLLGVRQGIDHDTPGLPPLTRFVPRAHDDGLSDRMARGGVVALVGGSSTGKSRSAWEAVRVLGREWRLWRPGRWSELEDLAPYTVIWLGDPRQLTEEHAEWLVAVVSDDRRGPITVVATIWPEDWPHLTADAIPGEPDHRYWRRTLLARGEIRVPDTFTPLDAADLATAVQKDRRWDRAAHEAGDRVIQYFAGVPRLVELYEHGPAMVQALIKAAMDAHRLGVDPLLPRDFLVEAAPGYPSDTEWLTVRGTPWPDEALGVAGAPVRGLPGPLHPHVPRTLDTTEPAGYTLTPYLAQLGRAGRQTELPPASFWKAAQRHLPPTAWAELAQRADGYGFHRIGARLRKAALTAGVSAQPAELLRRVPDPGADGVNWLVHNSPVTNLRDIRHLSRALVDRDARVTLVRRTTVDVNFSDWTEIGWLIDELAQLGDAEAIALFLARDPGRTLPVVGTLLPSLVALDRPAGELYATRLLAKDTVLSPWTVELLAKAGLHDAVRAAVCDIAPPPDTEDLVRLLRVLSDNGFDDEVRSLLGPAPPVPARAWEAAELVHVLDRLGRRDDVLALVDRVNENEHMLLPAHWTGQLEGLPGYARDRLRLLAPIKPTGQRMKLSLAGLEEDGEEKFLGLSQVAAEAAVAALGPADGPETLNLLRALRHDGHAGPRDALVRRIDPAGIAGNDTLLCLLAEELGPGPQSKTILARVLAGIGPWYSKFNRRVVIPALQATGNDDLLVQLAERIRDTGNFDAYMSLVPAQQETYRYGREPDKSPSAAWSWASLP